MKTALESCALAMWRAASRLRESRRGTAIDSGAARQLKAQADLLGDDHPVGMAARAAIARPEPASVKCLA